MTIAAIVKYTSDAQVVQKARPAHRRYLSQLIDQGKVAAAGAFQDGSGGLILYKVQTISEAEELVRNDPFVRAGVIAGYELKEWEIHGVSPDPMEVSK